MAPSTPKTSFKNYEVQARLLRAVVAAHPEVKWDYKNIALYFGESTVDGIQFQFRAIKKDAANMRAAVLGGTSPVKAIALKTPTTNRRRTIAIASGSVTPSTSSVASFAVGTPRTPSLPPICETPAMLGDTPQRTGVSSVLGNMTVRKTFVSEDADVEPDPEATPSRPPSKKRRFIGSVKRDGENRGVATALSLVDQGGVAQSVERDEEDTPRAVVVKREVSPFCREAAGRFTPGVSDEDIGYTVESGRKRRRADVAAYMEDDSTSDSGREQRHAHARYDFDRDRAI